MTLTRRENESLELYLSSEIDPSAPVGTIFGSGPIVIQVQKIRESQVSLGIDAPAQIIVLRDELGHKTEID